MAILDFYTTKVFLSGNNSYWQISFDWLMFAGSINYDTLSNMNVQIKDDYISLLMLALSENVELDNITTSCVTADDEIPGFSNYNNVIGALLFKPLPANMAACIKQVTEAPNAKHNGRMFIAGCPENSQAGGNFTGAQTTLLNTFATQLMVDLAVDSPDDAEFHPGVISRYEGGSKRPTPVFYRAASYSADVNMRQQRRRTTERLGIST